MSPPIALQVRLGGLFLLVALIPGSIAMGFAFHLDGPSPTAVGICLFTLLPTLFVAFFLGHLLAKRIFGEAMEQMQRYQDEHERSIQLAELDRLRSELVSSASHELRTPLSSLTVYMDALADDWDRMPDAQKHEIARRMQRIGQRMNRLVGDLLLAAQIQARGLPVAREPIVLSPLMEQARVEVEALQPGVPIDVQGTGECVVQADAVRVQQVLVNLLHNAVKFADPGSRVCVRWEPEGEEVAVTVRNRGPILPGDQMARLFVPFGRLATGAAPVGTGLGLYVSKHLVEAMGGRITVGAEEGMMAFGFTLPRQAQVSVEQMMQLDGTSGVPREVR